MPKILVVEDDKDLNRLVCACLRDLGHDVTCAFDGAEALTHIGENKYDLLLTDIMMPQSDGFTLLEYFNKKHYMDDVPVFVISADTSTAANMKAFRLGAEAMITKPFSTGFLQKHIEHIMELYELRRSAN